MRRPNWPERSKALVDRAATLLPQRTLGRRDPAMPTLDAALDVGLVLPEIARVLGQADPSNLRIAPPELIRHKPGRRALVLYRFEGANTPPLLGKIRAKGPDSHTPQIHHALRAAGLDGRTDKGIGVPRVLGRIDTMNMWLQQKVPGETLEPYLDTPRSSRTEVFDRTGAALARLHEVPAAADRHWTLADEADVLDRALEMAARDMPDAGVALRTIRRNARVRLERLTELELRGIHRDFYFDQMQVDAERIWLLDLDLYSVGDPTIDLGNFLAHLDELGLRKFSDVTAFDAQASAFLSGYARVLPLPPAARIDTLRAVSLARHIHISTRFEARRHITDDLVSLSLSALNVTDRRAS